MTMVLGVGDVTAVFSIVNCFVFRDLPYIDVDDGGLEAGLIAAWFGSRFLDFLACCSHRLPIWRLTMTSLRKLGVREG